jgi:hypothetical protein
MDKLNFKILKETTETTNFHRWRHIPGLHIWRVNKEWRLRLYRPWSNQPLVETQGSDLFISVYVLGVGAGWWK